MAGFIAYGRKNLGRCLDCRNKAFFGATLGWVLAGLIAVFGDCRRLLVAIALFAAGLSALWLAHRLVFAIRRRMSLPQSSDAAGDAGARDVAGADARHR